MGRPDVLRWQRQALLLRWIVVLVATIAVAACARATTPIATVTFQQPGSFGDSKLIVAEQTLYTVATLDAGVQVRTITGAFAPTVPPISANWQSVTPYTADEILVVASSDQDRRVRLYEVTPRTGEALLRSVVAAPAAGELLIDPTVAIYNGQVLVTYTRITGTVNNADPNTTNGDYTLVLMAETPAGWEERAIIDRQRANLEDGRLLTLADGTLAFVYERETIDKGPSIIQVRKSVDAGGSWNEPQVLVSNGADNEPAYVQQQTNGLVLYYSTDLSAPDGEWYEGGRIQRMQFDQEFGNRSEAQPIGELKAVLLLDGAVYNDQLYLLMIQHYALPSMMLTQVSVAE